MPFDALPQQGRFMPPPGLAEGDTMDTLVLKEALRLIRTPNRWCRGAARIRKWFAPTQYCLVGAVYQASENLSAFSEADVLQAIRWAIAERNGCLLVAWFNDDPTTTHGDVVAIVNRAIELSRTVARQTVLASALMDERAAVGRALADA